MSHHLDMAVVQGNINKVKLLISQGEDINTKNQYDDTPLDIAIRDGHINIVKLLLSHGANITEKSLARAVALEYTDIAKLLVSHGADINARGYLGKSPLDAAATNGKINIAKLLISCNADVNTRNKNEETPLHIAVYNGHIDIARLLISHGADVNCRNKNEETPLHIAVYTQRVDIARLLISKKADVNVRDKNENTPLHDAARVDRIDIVKLLVSSKADINARDKNGNIPADVTADYEIINFLTPKGAEKSEPPLLCTPELEERRQRKRNDFPTYEEFGKFLELNSKRKFDQDKYYTCAMSVCAHGPVGEGYSSDVDIGAPEWFREFERRTTFSRGGIWTGGQLLEVLKEIDPLLQPVADGK